MGATILKVIKMILYDLWKTAKWENIENYMFKAFGENHSLAARYKGIFEAVIEEVPLEEGAGMTLMLNEVDGENVWERTFISAMFPNSPVHYSLEFVSFKEWLSLEVHERTVSNYTKSEIIFYCIEEMSVGFDRKW